MGERQAGGSAVDISESIADARREWREAGDDLLWQEMASTYVVLGELLEAGRDDTTYVDECRDLADRLAELDRQWQRRSDQRWEAWRSRNTTDNEGGDRS